MISSIIEGLCLIYFKKIFIVSSGPTNGSTDSTDQTVNRTLVRVYVQFGSNNIGFNSKT